MSVELRRTFLIALGGWPWLSIRCSKMVKALPQMPVEGNKKTDCQLGFQNTLCFECGETQTGASPGFFSKKRLRNITRCTRWMPTTVHYRLISSVFSPVSLIVCWNLFILLGDQELNSKQWPSQDSNSDFLIRIPAPWPQGHHVFHDNNRLITIENCSIFLWDFPENKHFETFPLSNISYWPCRYSSEGSGYGVWRCPQKNLLPKCSVFIKVPYLAIPIS